MWVSFHSCGLVTPGTTMNAVLPSDVHANWNDDINDGGLSEHARLVWIQSLRSQHKLVDQKRNAYWRKKIELQSSPTQLWRAVDKVLCRERINVVNPARSASEFADFFIGKVNAIRAATDGASAPTFNDVHVESPLRWFQKLHVDDVVKLIHSAPAKPRPDLDPAPTCLVKDCVHLVAPFVTHLFNTSLSTGSVPDAFKAACITPLLKKPGLDVDVVENYRPVSNLSSLSKLLERAVCNQLESHLVEAGLFPQHQSAYRKGHSTETALVKVCADLVKHMDSGHHVLLALLDLLAAFDTVDHSRFMTRYGPCHAIFHLP